MYEPSSDRRHALHSAPVRPEDCGDGYLKQRPFPVVGRPEVLRNASDIRADDNRRRLIAHVAMLLAAAIFASVLMVLMLSLGSGAPKVTH